MTTTTNQNQTTHAILTCKDGTVRPGIIVFRTTTFVALKEVENNIEAVNYYYFPVSVNVVKYTQRDIATIVEEKSYLKPFEVRVLKFNARYAETLGRFETSEEAIALIKEIGATPVSEYHFKKEISCL